MASTPPLPPYLTPAQIQAQAAAQATAAQAPARNDITQQQSDAAAASQQQGQAIIGLSQALANELGGIAPHIEETYRNAAKDQSAFAAGFSQTLQQLQGQTAGQTNDFLGKIGAPDAQMLHPSAASGDALYGLTGYLPGKSLSEQGAAFSSAAQFLPATALLEGQRQFAVNTAKGQQEQKKFEQWLKELDDAYPGELAKAIQGMNDEQLQRYSAQIQGLYLQNTLRSTGANITGFDPVTGQPTFANQQTQQATANKKADKLAGAWDTFYGNVDGDTNNFFKTTTNELTGQEVTKPIKTRAQAFSILWNKYGKKLVRAGANAKKVRQEINQALTNAGYPKPTMPKKPKPVLGFTETPRKPGGRPH